MQSLSASFSSPTDGSAQQLGSNRTIDTRGRSDSAEVGEVEVQSVSSVKALQSVFKQPVSAQLGGEASDEANALADFRPMLARIEANDPTLTWLDWTGNRTFIALSSERKSEVLLRLAAGRALETVLLNSTGLDNTNASAIAQLMRRSTTLQGLSLQSNNFYEPGATPPASSCA